MVRDGASEIACVADGFVVYCCGPKAAPFALVAAYQWADYVDLVTRGADLRRKRRRIGAFVPGDLIERIRGYRANQDSGSRLPAAPFTDLSSAGHRQRAR